MLMVPEDQLQLFVKVLRKTGADITYHERATWRLRPVFQGMYMGQLIWGTLEGVVVQIQCSEPDTLNSLSELFASTVQALAQGEKNGSVSESTEADDSKRED